MNESMHRLCYIVLLYTWCIKVSAECIALWCCARVVSEWTQIVLNCDVAGAEITLKCNSEDVCHFYREWILWKSMCILITIIQMQSYGVWQSKVRIFAGIPWHENVFLTSTHNGSAWLVQLPFNSSLHIVSSQYTVFFFGYADGARHGFSEFFLLGLSGMSCYW
jgi:hypothetical protein